MCLSPLLDHKLRDAKDRDPLMCYRISGAFCQREKHLGIEMAIAPSFQLAFVGFFLLEKKNLLFKFANTQAEKIKEKIKQSVTRWSLYACRQYAVSVSTHICVYN